MQYGVDIFVPRVVECRLYQSFKRLHRENTVTLEIPLTILSSPGL